jgi:hypothetical protein
MQPSTQAAVSEGSGTKPSMGSNIAVLQQFPQQFLQQFLQQVPYAALGQDWAGTQLVDSRAPFYALVEASCMI